jgi:hypothetical protein
LNFDTYEFSLTKADSFIEGRVKDEDLFLFNWLFPNLSNVIMMHPGELFGTLEINQMIGRAAIQNIPIGTRITKSENTIKNQEFSL